MKRISIYLYGNSFFMEFIINNTIKLEQTAPSHAQPLFAAIDRNRQHLRKFLSWVDYMQSADDVAKYIESCQSLNQAGEELSFVIMNDQVLCGRIGLHLINRQHKNAEIGYWLTEEAQGNGIVTACCKELINYAFRQLGLHRITIKAAVENHRSQSVPQRLGFTTEGILRGAELVNKQFLDLIVYSILKQEWAAENVVLPSA